MRVTSPTHLSSVFPFAFTSLARLRKHPIRSLVLASLVAVVSTAFGSTVSSASFRQLIAGVGFGNSVANVWELTEARHETNPLLTAAPQSGQTMMHARRAHTATLLADGRVLVAGGEDGAGLISQTELFDPTAGTFSEGANLNNVRADHSATRLADGRVLIAGGRGAAGSLSTTEIFNPSTGSLVSGQSMSVARAGHSATLFADGRVLIAGGDSNGSAEIFDPSSGTFSSVGASMASPRSMHSAALLQDGRVLIVGGRDAAGSALNSAEIFDTSGSSFSTVASQLRVSRLHAHLRVLFDGKVQIIGGSADGSMEIYDPLSETIGAYAHVVPETDTCAGLPAYVLASQTRAALFHNGQTDPLFDRSGQTITEMNGQALVAGGANSGGAVLNSFAVVASTSASITTDKLDYAPGETVLISGRGFQPGETVRLKIHEDPHTPQERGFDTVADANGNFAGTYLVMDYDLDMKFVVGARGLTSGATAQTTMTDSQPTSVTLTPNTQTVNPGNDGVYAVSVDMGGNSSNCSMTLSAPFSAPAPVGVSVAFSGGASITTNADFSKTLTLNTTNTGPMADRTQPGTYPFTLTVARGAGCQGSGNTTTSGTLIVASPNVAPVASAVSISGTPQYGQLLTGNYTYSDADGDAQGASTFRWLRNGTTQVATNQTYTAVAGDVGQTLTFEVTPVAAAGTSPGTAVQSASVTINKKSVTASVAAGNKTYDANTTATITGCTLTGVLAGDTANVTCSAAGPNTFANANVGTGKTVTAANISLSGSASANYILSSTSAATTANITTKALTATLTASDKPYDGNVTEPNATMSCSLTGVLASDTGNVTCTATAGAFNSPNVASANQVTATVTISGTAAGNYTLGAAGTSTTTTSATATVHITPKTLTASIIGNPTKNYDGTLNATLTPANFSLSGLVGSESFTVTKTMGTYNSANVVAATTVTTSLVAGDFTPGGGTSATNYNLPTTASGAGQIDKANATVVVSPYSVTYDGQPHTATAASITGVNGETGSTVGTVDVSNTTHTNAATYASDYWSFTGTANYNNIANTTITNLIDKANAVINVSGHSGVYDGNTHGATGTAVGVETSPADLNSLLHLGASFTNVPGGTANWTFDGNGNYNPAAGSVAIELSKANAVINVTGYSGVYDGNAHGATGTAVGVETSPADLNSLLHLGASFTNVPGGTANWTFDGNGNYNPAAGSVAIELSKANAACTITGYNVIYDGNPHTATGQCLGVQGETLAGPDLSGTTHTPASNYTDNWTFTDLTGNYNNASSTVNNVIDQAASTTTIDCSPDSFIYTGSDITPCTAMVTRVGDPNTTVTVVYASNTNVGAATADASYSGDANHTGSVAAQVSFTIIKRTLTASIIGNPTKVYDGTTNATLNSANYSVSNLAPGQSVTVNKNSGTYNTNDVATCNSVSVTLAIGDFSAGGGTNLNNYNLPTSASGPGHITPKPLTIKAEDKTMPFGGPIPAYTVTYTTLASGDTAGSLGGTLAFAVKDYPAMTTNVPIDTSTPSGIYAIIPSGLTSTNYTITFTPGTLTVDPWWTVMGFYQPVDMNVGSTFILNTIKGGQTVPLKFNIYAGTPGPLTEKKSVSDVMFGTVQVAEYNCAATPGYENPVDVSNTGSTSLRYDGTQFIQNWQTPKGANKCYQVRMTALDGSHLDAFFKTK